MFVGNKYRTLAVKEFWTIYVLNFDMLISCLSEIVGLSLGDNKREMNEYD